MVCSDGLWMLEVNEVVQESGIVGVGGVYDKNWKRVKRLQTIQTIKTVVDFGLSGVGILLWRWVGFALCYGDMI